MNASDRMRMQALQSRSLYVLVEQMLLKVQFDHAQRRGSQEAAEKLVERIVACQREMEKCARMAAELTKAISERDRSAQIEVYRNRLIEEARRREGRKP